jgi:hypothetical protein
LRIAIELELHPSNSRLESAVDKRMTRTPALFDADVLAEAIVREVGTNIERLFGAYPELA